VARLDGSPGTPTIATDAILVATGRRANVEGLGLDTVGVRLDHDGAVQVDDFLQTTNPRIFACGDVALPWKFTHAADAAARLVVQNALVALGGLGRRRLSGLRMSWCTFTDPEVAQLGLTDREARDRQITIDTYRRGLEQVDRAVTERTTNGFVKVHTREGTDAIVGATIVGPRAGELIGELALAMTAGIGLGTLSRVVRPYPTFANALGGCSDDYNRTRLTPLVRRLLAWRLG
jgi:pyruvate/2-oxoglutarate dehydrogenase complex dihydrolipoamide dehydrogenase (E3) component